MANKNLQIAALLFIVHYRQGHCGVDPEKDDKCELETGRYCIPMTYCVSAIQKLKRGERPTSLCGFVKGEPYICCDDPVEGMERTDIGKSISSKMCEDYKDKGCSRVIGGIPVEAKELPFMTLIGYGSGDDVEWKCGGSLISSKYVLSAAHCAESEEVGPATWARIGERDRRHQITNDSSVNPDMVTPIQVRIALRFIHPGYKPSSNYNDIALFRLRNSVFFNDFLKPACLSSLPATGEIKKAWIGGFGRTHFIGPLSNRLLKAEVDILSPSRCKKYEADKGSLAEGFDNETMICARSEERGSDTCQGDSGGPLFTAPELICEPRILVGITSFGIGCGDAEFPGVYTSVHKYIGWIESIVWPGNVSDVNVVWKNWN